MKQIRPRIYLWVLLVACNVDRRRSNMNSISREYTIREENPWSFLTCPRGFFISKLTIHLPSDRIFGTQLPDLRGNTTLSLTGLIDEQNLRIGRVRGPCDTLQMCLGHQSCIFILSNEFCQNDPLPGIRKLIILNMVCKENGRFPHALVNSLNFTITELKDFHQRKYHVVHISYNSEGQIDRRITAHRIPRNEVFDLKCPPPTRFSGECSGLDGADTAVDVDEHMWTVLGRVSSRQCRAELLNVHCAYRYNQHARCVPRHLIIQKNGTFSYDSWSMRSLPQLNQSDLPDRTNHRKVLQDPHMGLIPTRLAFLILAHQQADQVMDMLRVIYSPRHFYVVHMDYRGHENRQALIKQVKYQFPKDNIRVLPTKRSFTSSWGAYGLMRAELEVMAELLGMGIWDFCINLSPSDLPLRPVEDFAATLAPHRGTTFIAYSNNSMPDAKTKAWYACDGHLYNVAPRAEHKRPAFVMSQWGVFSREVVEYLTSQDRGDTLNKMQFYAQTTAIPDESYIINMLMNSPYRSSIFRRSFHFINHFVGPNHVTPCRHSKDADFCGLGPSIFREGDRPPILKYSHHYFFGRKFNLSSSDTLRNSIKTLVRGNAYTNQMTQMFIPLSMQRQMASLAIRSLAHKITEGNLNLARISSMTVTPSVHTSDPCCQISLDRFLMFAENFNIILKFSLKESNNKVLDARASLSPTMSGRCFPSGHLRMIHLTTFDEISSPGARPTAYPMGLPVAGSPVSKHVLFMRLHLHVGSVTEKCAAAYQESLENTRYAHFSPEGMNHTSKGRIHFEAVLFEPTGRERCKHAISIDNNTHPETDGFVFTHEFHCGMLIPGQWEVRLTQLNTEWVPYIYRASVYLTPDPSSLGPNEDQLHGLWRVNDVMVINKTQERAYYTPFKQERRSEMSKEFSKPPTMPHQGQGHNQSENQIYDVESGSCLIRSAAFGVLLGVTLILYYRLFVTGKLRHLVVSGQGHMLTMLVVIALQLLLFYWT